MPALQCWGHSLTNCNTTPPAKSKIAAWGAQNGKKSANPYDHVCSLQVSLIKFLDPNTPSMRKVDNRKKGENGNKRK